MANEAEELIDLAAAIRQKSSELDTLKNTLRHKFVDEKYKPIVEPILANNDLADTLVTSVNIGATTVSEKVSKVISQYFVASGLLAIALFVIAGTIVFNTFGSPLPENFSLSLVSVVVVILAIVGFAIVLISSITSLTNFEKFWERVQKVLELGTFYFFAGLVLLLYAFHTANAREHPSLTFLIAMIGVAITLFGTGSQAAGAIATAGARLPRPSEAIAAANASDAATGDASPAVDDEPASADLTDATVLAESRVKAVAGAVEEGLKRPTDADKAAALARLTELTKSAVDASEEARRAAARGGSTNGRDWSLIKANAAVAGGAAVLTALFGWGVISYRQEISEVFGEYNRYVLIRIDACASLQTHCSPQDRVHPVDEFRAFSLEEFAIKAQMGQGAPIFVDHTATTMYLLVREADLTAGPYLNLTMRRLAQPSPTFDDDLELSIPSSTLSQTASGDITDLACQERSNRIIVDCRLSPVVYQSSDRIEAHDFVLNFVKSGDITLEAVHAPDVTTSQAGRAAIQFK